MCMLRHQSSHNGKLQTVWNHLYCLVLGLSTVFVGTIFLKGNLYGLKNTTDYTYIIVHIHVLVHRKKEH